MRIFLHTIAILGALALTLAMWVAFFKLLAYLATLV